ncbi:hypothetical protein E1A91_A02G193500v1 [Gossypium mustelinum]|uniref:non-specific serine/threonine protein kinase n=1 Tax=Gossypium mustelinum TaxID=34275 RepID=A0A5D3A9J5_GOSMU|nr:hypothetical protein E1A91_A02G193500v1 [Gossypium mustelinum]
MAMRFLLEDSQTHDHSHNHKQQIWLILIIVILIALLGFSVFFFFCRRKLNRNRSHNGGLKAEKLKLRYFKLEELEKATENFIADCLLGSGAFGNVYKGSFEGEGTLAIKRAHVESYQTTEEFRNEVRLLSTVNHPNLVALVGFSEESGPKGAKILVYEYVPHGSLREYIIGRGGRNFTWRQRVNIAIGAAKGIAHLHDGIKPCIIHRDIKPSNILIGERFEAKVSDFGLVKMGPIGDQSHVSSQVKGTPGYLDPAYCTSFHLSPFSDVYSFGVILLQLVSGRPAVDTTRNHIIDWQPANLDQTCAEVAVEKCRQGRVSRGATSKKSSIQLFYPNHAIWK